MKLSQQKSLSDISDIKDKIVNFDELVSDVDSLNAKFTSLCQNQDRLDKNVTQLKNRVSPMETKRQSSNPTNADNQTSSLKDRDYELIIGSLPKIPRLELLNTLHALATQLELGFQSSTIATAFQFKSANGNYLIVVKFNSTFIRDDWLSAKKKKRKLQANDVIATAPQNKIFINAST